VQGSATGQETLRCLERGGRSMRGTEFRNFLSLNEDATPSDARGFFVFPALF
jgi:hypothetical protein